MATRGAWRMVTKPLHHRKLTLATVHVFVMYILTFSSRYHRHCRAKHTGTPTLAF
jgi:hypothetical protein